MKKLFTFFLALALGVGMSWADVIPCTAADLGKVLCTDGSIYATVSDATAASKTAAAVIAYIDTENNKGLALALADDGGEMDWATAKTTAAAHTPAVSGGTWKLATKDEWDNMITAAGSYTALRDGFSGVGGTNMNEAKYWSSTPENANAWCYYFNYGMWVDGYVDNPCWVRACLEFDVPAPEPAECGLEWLGVPEGGVVGTIGHEDEVVLPQLYATNPDFINAFIGGSVTVRLGSTDESVLKVNGFNDFQVIAAGECDVYVVHDADADFAYDSAAFHVTIKEAAIPLVANEGVTLRDYTKEAGWWQMTAQVGMYAISISPDADALAGTYDVQNLNPQYNGIYDFTADQQNPVKISFVSGSFTVVVDAEAHSVTVAGEIACSDGKTYAITLLYVQPEAKATVELNYADATLSDHIADAGQFQIAGMDMENQTIASFVIYSNAVVGEYTEADLNPNYSYIYAGGAQQTIYSATLKVEEFEGGHKLTGDVLCYNNTLYKVTLVVPAAETGIEDVQLSGKAVKAFRDGQVVIIRDGKIYNIGGAQVK